VFDPRALILAIKDICLVVDICDYIALEFFVLVFASIVAMDPVELVLHSLSTGGILIQINRSSITLLAKR